MMSGDVRLEDWVEEYIVVGGNGASVRVGRSLFSRTIGKLPRTRRVLVAEKKGRRLRIVNPLEGWISHRTFAGYYVAVKPGDDNLEFEEDDTDCFSELSLFEDDTSTHQDEWLESQNEWALGTKSDNLDDYSFSFTGRSTSAATTSMMSDTFRSPSFSQPRASRSSFTSPRTRADLQREYFQLSHYQPPVIKDNYMRLPDEPDFDLPLRPIARPRSYLDPVDRFPEDRMRRSTSRMSDRGFVSGLKDDQRWARSRSRMPERSLSHMPERSHHRLTPNQRQHRGSLSRRTGHDNNIDSRQHQKEQYAFSPRQRSQSSSSDSYETFPVAVSAATDFISHSSGGPWKQSTGKLTKPVEPKPSKPSKPAPKKLSQKQIRQQQADVIDGEETESESDGSESSEDPEDVFNGKTKNRRGMVSLSLARIMENKNQHLKKIHAPDSAEKRKKRKTLINRPEKGWWKFAKNESTPLHGKWVLDRNGEGFDKMLRRMGTDSWLERKIARSQSSKCQIVHMEGTAWWYILTNDKGLECCANGEPFSTKNSNGKLLTVKASYDLTNGQLDLQTSGLKKGMMLISRRVNEKDEMEMRIMLGQDTCVRYFRREVSTSLTSMFSSLNNLIGGGEGSPNKKKESMKLQYGSL